MLWPSIEADNAIVSVLAYPVSSQHFLFSSKHFATGFSVGADFKGTVVEATINIRYGWEQTDYDLL
jgi:uncharacterized protein YifE (UPF0438 family)